MTNCFEKAKADYRQALLREVRKINKILTSLLEPAIILVMGLIVGFIVMAMLLPIFEINMGIQ